MVLWPRPHWFAARIQAYTLSYTLGLDPESARS